MRYHNPIIKGFYPDPSVCEANGKYYLVSSSFQFFPGVPLFESEDLVNWNQTGHVLTRKNQVMLENINSSGGVFAPTIRFYQGRFYMVTNNNTTNENFYVYTDDIYGEWSDPIVVDQGGIDPSLYFEGNKCYFISNGSDENGKGCVVQCEIEAETGKKLTPSTPIWSGNGGRYLESPHMYKFGDMYYLMAAEGGTEYGHMVTICRSSSIWGPFENCPHNPILTNRNKAPYIIQGIGHGDLIQDKLGNHYIITLGFRQIGEWEPYHHLGREVFLTPLSFKEDGWFYAGPDGTTEESYEIPGDFNQMPLKCYTFENTDWHLDWCFLRHPYMENYELGEHSVTLTGTEITLNEPKSPTFVGVRQRDFNMDLSVIAENEAKEAGITLYMNESEHYELALSKTENGTDAFLHLHIGDADCIKSRVMLSSNKARLIIRSTSTHYNFYVEDDGRELYLGNARSKYLSSEVSGGFTGVVMGLYAVNGKARFEEFKCEYL